MSNGTCQSSGKEFRPGSRADRVLERLGLCIVPDPKLPRIGIAASWVRDVCHEMAASVSVPSSDPESVLSETDNLWEAREYIDVIAEGREETVYVCKVGRVVNLSCTAHLMNW